jgi:hypothetical protein
VVPRADLDWYAIPSGYEAFAVPVDPALVRAQADIRVGLGGMVRGKCTERMQLQRDGAHVRMEKCAAVNEGRAVHIGYDLRMGGYAGACCMLGELSEAFVEDGFVEEEPGWEGVVGRKGITVKDVDDVVASVYVVDCVREEVMVYLVTGLAGEGEKGCHSKKRLRFERMTTLRSQVKLNSCGRKSAAY